MTSLSLICEYGSSSEDEDVVEVMEVEGAVKENLNPLGELPPPPPTTPFKVASLFDADIIAVVESLISRVERRHQHHYQNNNHHHHHHHHQQYPFSTSSYRSGNDNHDDEETSEEELTATSDSDSELSVWSAFSVEDEEEEEEDCFGGRKAAKATQGRPKAKHCVTKGEFTVDDLPPIERLQISVDVRCLTQVGIVCSMVNQLVVVQSFKSVPVLDLETVLFCREGTSIGQIFDVIGPVKQPNYVLRFNSPEEAAVDCKLALNSPIYYAEENGAQQQQQQQQTRPENCLTRYVFVQQLQSEKGCDASWKHNNEPPPEEIDYSDDEEERARKRRAQKRNRSAGGGFRSSSGVPTF